MDKKDINKKVMRIHIIIRANGWDISFVVESEKSFYEIEINCVHKIIAQHIGTNGKIKTIGFSHINTTDLYYRLDFDHLIWQLIVSLIGLSIISDLNIR